MSDFEDDILDLKLDIDVQDFSQYYPAHFKRVIHFVVDNAVFLFMSGAVTLIVYPGYYEPEVIPPNALFLFYFTYVACWFIFEYVFNRTPAKFLTKTKVVALDGTKPSVKAILVRTLARFIPFEFITYLGKRKYGLHDSLSKTRLVNNNFSLI